jgi:hypothetical protein
MKLNNEYIQLAKLSTEELIKKEKSNMNGLENKEANIRLEKMA